MRYTYKGALAQPLKPGQTPALKLPALLADLGAGCTRAAVLRMTSRHISGFQRSGPKSRSYPSGPLTGERTADCASVLSPRAHRLAFTTVTMDSRSSRLVGAVIEHCLPLLRIGELEEQPALVVVEQKNRSRM